MGRMCRYQMDLPVGVGVSLINKVHIIDCFSLLRFRLGSRGWQVRADEAEQAGEGDLHLPGDDGVELRQGAERHGPLAPGPQLEQSGRSDTRRLILPGDETVT